MKVVAPHDAKVVRIAGYGITIPADFEISPGIVIRSNPPHHDPGVLADGCEFVGDYAGILAMQEFASLYLEIEERSGGQALITKAWNSMWLFHLLALGCRCPCYPLYTWSGTKSIQFAVSTPHSIFQDTDSPIAASATQLVWVRSHLREFDLLLADPAFTASLLNFANAHHLFGFESRIMQIWAGIERLFKVSSEISRTLALYSALVLENESPEKRYECYKRIRKDYDIRSKVVLGALGKGVSVKDAYHRASNLLVSLLARCIELESVPSADELDRASLVGFISPPI
jgi:hypothetical protein